VKKNVGFAITVLVILSFLLACASPAPTAAPTKPSAPAVATVAPATAATTSPAAADTKPAAAPTSAPAVKVKRGGTLRASQQGDWQTMDPHTSGAIGYSAELIFDSLVDYHMAPDGKFVVDPWLVASWDIKDKEYTFKLEKGVKFHDGSEFNADAVKYNLDRMLNHSKSRLKASMALVDKVEAPDASTVKVTMKAPWAAFLPMLSAYPSDVKPYIISKAAAEKLGDNYGTSPETTVGSGPMKLIGWLKNSNQDLERFEGYWKMGEDGKPLPYFDKANFRFIADTSVTVVELKAGSLDFAERIDGRDVPSVKANTNLVFRELPQRANTVYSMGIDPTIEPFASKKQLRQALRFAIDKQSVAQVIGEGIGVMEYYWWPENTIGYDSSLPKHSYDPAKVKQLLTEAGYPNGLDVKLAVVARPQDQRMGEVLKQMWDGQGIRTTIDSMERLAYFSAAAAHRLQVITFRAHLHPDPDMMGVQMVTGGAANWFNWSDPNMDKCMADGRTTMDEAQRAQIYKRCQQILFEEGVYGPIFSWKYNDVTTTRVQNYPVNWKWPRFKRIWLSQ
jgi:peptide/nickel transport system substrate-binding protein